MLRAGRSRLSGKASGQYLYFQKYDAQRSWNTTLDGTWRFPLVRITPFVLGTRTNTKDRPGYEIDSRARRVDRTAGFGSGIGNGLSNSSNRFAAYVQGLRDSGLDVVFVIDATGSMDWVIDEVRRRVGDIADATRTLVPLTRFGVVAYRDHDDPEFVVRQQTLTFSLAKLARFIDTLEAKGGGSWQEAVYAGLDVAVNRAGWRPGAKRVVLLIGDAPPDETDLGGTLALARELQRSGGRLSALDVSNDSNPALIEASLGRAVNRAL